MDPIHILIQHLQNHINLSPNDIDKIRSIVSVEHLNKKAFLLSGGQVSSHMNFIAKGCLNNFYIDEEGKKQMIVFGVEQWWINDLYSYLTGKSSDQYIQALEDSIVVRIHKDHLTKLYDEIPTIERFFRIKFERAYVASQERTLYSIHKSAEERFLEFTEKHKNIEQRVPQYMLASYLGITPEFLSMLRKKRQ